MDTYEELLPRKKYKVKFATQNNDKEEIEVMKIQEQGV